jgi:S-adenosylmethionine-diacylglycerol 3-amino-3-carboxypropyl transferase
MSILYSQCWEDPQLLSEALAVTPTEDVLSIASAGDNSFALLLDGPRTITAIDFNCEQLHLMELKMAATTLSYEDFVVLLGARPSGSRLDLYRTLRHDLSPAARRYWDQNEGEIRRGVIHSGKLERYLTSFRRWVLPLVHSQGLVRDLLTAPSPAEQEMLYQTRWNRRRWRWLFRLFFSEAVMSRFGRHPAWFNQVSMQGLGGALLERTRLGLTQVPASDNYFLEYMLTGNYRSLESAPPYLRPGNFKILRERVSRIKLQCCSLTDALNRGPGGGYSCFNLSDVFEYMSPEESDRAWKQLVGSARPGSRMVYRTLFVKRRPPLRLAHCVREIPAETPAEQRDRTFFYDDFVALEAC